MHLAHHLVGVTTQCDVPCDADIPVVGDALSVNVESILAVEPDVLLVQMDPSEFRAVREMAPQVRIEHFTIETLADIARAIERIGAIAGQGERGREQRAAFEAELDRIRRAAEGKAHPRVLFVYGYERTHTAGAGTFVDDMITLAGGINVAAQRYRGWTTIHLEQILALKPEVLICQCAPAARQRAKSFWSSLEDLPAARSGGVHIVTDRAMTIPSTQSVRFARRLAEMIHGGPLERGSDE